MQLLSETAIEAINKNKRCKPRLALGLGKTVNTIERWLRDAEKKDNEMGVMLTTAQAMQVIREETGLTDDQILTQENKA